MSAPATAAAIKRIDPLVVFIERADARAFLWWAGLIDILPEAVDPLHELAKSAGLDVDRAQQIIANAFAPYRASEP